MDRNSKVLKRQIAEGFIDLAEGFTDLAEREPFSFIMIIVGFGCMAALLALMITGPS